MKLLLILTAASLFFLASCSITWGILILLKHIQQGVWFLAGGGLAEFIALVTASLAGISTKSSNKRISVIR